MADENLSAEEIEALAPTYIGPTWARGPLGNFIEPEKTLGWGVIFWAEKWLNGLDGGSWQFTPEQERFLLWWYALDESGQFSYRSGVLQRLKGWGKDPLAAIMCLVEFVGPCQFWRWDANEPGGAVGKPHPRSWVQVAAVSREQTVNTMSLMPALMSDRLVQEYGIKPGAELIRAHRGRCRLEAVTSSFRSLEGKRSTFVILNETHHWVAGNGGPQMYEVVNQNVGKMNCRYLAITNAYLPGEDSTAEKMRFAYEMIQEGRAEDVGMLYDSIEAHPKTPMTREALEIVIPKIRGDAVWLNVDAIINSALNITVSVARSRRMWLNQIIADADALFGPDDMKDIERDATLSAGDEVVLGFDGSKYEDSTALVAIRIKDRSTFVLGLWEKPSAWDEKTRGRWQVPADKVDSQVRSAFRTFTVKAMFADVNLWESYIADWSASYGDGLVVKATQQAPIGWDMRQSLQIVTRAHERLVSSIREKKIFCADLALRRHTLNARQRVNDYGVYFGKESPDSHRKVDAYAAWMLAHEALHRYLTNPSIEKKPRKSTGYFL